MKKQFSDRKLVACIELHTFSSLNKEFLIEYEGSMNEPDTAVVYFNPQSITHKKINSITKEQIHNAFSRKDLKVFTNSTELEQYLKSLDWERQNLLMMSSGNFNNIKLYNLIK